MNLQKIRRAHTATPARDHGLVARWQASLLLLCLVTGPAVAQDDTALFSTSFPPNVLLFVDNSGSMRTIMYHPAFDIEVYEAGGIDCDIISFHGTGYTSVTDQNGDEVRIDSGSDPNESQAYVRNLDYDAGFVSTPGTGHALNGYISRRFCGQTRRLYADGSVADSGRSTWWSEPYLEWYFNLDPTDAGTTWGPANQSAAEILAEIEDSANGIDFIDGSTFGKFQRARISAARDIAADVIYQTNTDCPAYGGDCGVYYDRVRFGLAKFQQSTWVPDPWRNYSAHGGYVRVGIDAYANNKSELESAIDAIDARGWTPLGETLFKLYTYFMSRNSADRPVGVDGVSVFPPYQYRDSDGAPGSLGGNVPGDPVQEACQKNFIIMITDGEPTRDDFEYEDGSWTPGFDAFEDDLIGDYAPDNPGDPDIGTDGTPEVGDPPWGYSHSAGYLDDIALFIQDTDLRNDFAGHQTVDIYTVGFNTRGPVNTLLEETARYGNGLSFVGNQAETLTEALVDSIQDIIIKSQSFTAATVPASRATDGNNFFASYFVPGDGVPYWEGHLKLFEFNALGEIRDAPVPPATSGNCALEDPLAPARCQVGRLQVELPGFWDAGEQIPPAEDEGAGERKLYVSLYGAARPTSLPAALSEFQATTLSNADLAFTELGIDASDIPDYQVAGDTTGIATQDELRQAIIRYVRGCEFNAGPCVDRGAGQKLWDIFHSNPVVVGPPNSGVGGDAYQAFANTYAHRKRVIYAGSNGGFVHGFDAGEFDPSTGGYDRGTGTELFGFMAHPARRRIAELPRDDARAYYYMDGSVQAADVWLYPTPTALPGDATTWDEWHSVLLGGMRQGGRAIWALDVSNPPDAAHPSGVTGGPTYPGYLWEFPCEDTAAAECTGSGIVPAPFEYADYMGETWSDPIVTRVKVRVNCGTGACPTYDRWVAIFGAGYDPLADPNLSHNADTSPGTRATDTLTDDYDASQDAGTSRAGRAVFMLDVASGEVLAMKRYDSDSSEGIPEMRYGFAAAPAVFDLDFDGYADVIYLADLGGNLWKWVVHDDVPDPIHGSGDVDQPEWPFHKVFSAASCTSCVPPHYQSFFSAPQGALVGPELYLTLGSGERADLERMPASSAGHNRYYVFRDGDPLERELPAPAAGSARFTDAAGSGDFVDVDTLSGNCLPPPSPAVGFYVEGEAGEKFITETEIFFGTVLTGSYTPSASANACEAGGTARLYGFDLFCGEGIFPSAGGPSNPAERSIVVGTGLPNRPRVSVGPIQNQSGSSGSGSCSDMAIVITSDGQTFSQEKCRPNSGIQLESWRDL